jgi:quinol monooxygenase YgiN
MHVVTVTFEIDQHHAQDFLTEVLANAEASLTEPGCLTFDVASDATGERLFLYEVYADKAAYEAHLGTAHFASFNERTAPWVLVKDAQEFRLMGPRFPAGIPAQATP